MIEHLKISTTEPILELTAEKFDSNGQQEFKVQL
jgi:hypothetical protein